MSNRPSMGKLSDFGGLNSAQSEKPKTDLQKKVVEPAKTSQSKTQDKPVTINIKIDRQLHNWLNTTARQIRENNTEPTTAEDRVFPQHLVNIAIQVLQKNDIDWTQIKSAKDLEKALNL